MNMHVVAVEGVDAVTRRRLKNKAFAPKAPATQLALPLAVDKACLKRRMEDLYARANQAYTLEDGKTYRHYWDKAAQISLALRQRPEAYTPVPRRGRSERYK